MVTAPSHPLVRPRSRLTMRATKAFSAKIDLLLRATLVPTPCGIPWEPCAWISVVTLPLVSRVEVSLSSVMVVLERYTRSLSLSLSLSLVLSLLVSCYSSLIQLEQAALFGCGCFATPLDANGNSAGVSVSGTGEEVTRSLLAFEAARKLRFYASGITASFPDMITNPLVPPTCNLNHAFHPPSVQFTDHVPAIPAVVAAVAGGPTTGSTPATTIHDISSIEGDSPPTTISSPCSSCECSGSEYDAEPEPWTPLQQLLQSFLDFKGPESLCCPASQSGCRSTDERAAGVVGLISHERGSVADVVWSHTTPSFAVGFLNSGDSECTVW